jgi:hypothetical protein
MVLEAVSARRRERTHLRSLMLWLCAWITATAAPARAHEPVRIVLSIGQDVGAPDEQPLRFAERDAARVAELLIALGDVDRERAYVLVDATADSVRRALTEIRGRSIELPDVVLITYISSHADEEALQLGPTRLPLRELRELLASVRARVRLLVVDACRSGVLVRTKGGKPVRPFAIDLEDPQPLEGQAIISSAASSEPAQEWDTLGGSLFTHHWLAALRGAGDRDGDGRVSLFEAYAYAYDRTVSASSAASAGLQHPSHELELRGAGDLVLTRPASRGSGLSLGPALSGRYLVLAAHSGELIAEFDKSEGRGVRLALDPGRYVIRKPEGSFVGVGELLVMPGGFVTLNDSDLQPVPYMEVARKGAGSIRTWSLDLRAGVASPRSRAEQFGPRIGAGFSRELGPWAYSLGLDWGMRQIRANELWIQQQEVWTGAELRLRWPLSWMLPFLGARAAAGLMHQTLERDEEQRIRRYFGGTGLPDRYGVGAELFATAGLDLPLQRTILRLTAAFGGDLVRGERDVSLRPSGQLRIDAGWRL